MVKTKNIVKSVQLDGDRFGLRDSFGGYRDGQKGDGGDVSGVPGSGHFSWYDCGCILMEFEMVRGVMY